MRTIFIILMVLMIIAVVAIAILNSEVVTVHYLFGQIELNLFLVILGSALVGIVIMILFMVYRSIHNYVKAESERSLKKELQRQLNTLEVENKKLLDEISKLQKEREISTEKARAELEAEKKKLEDELYRQQKERENAVVKEQAELSAERRRLEEELKKQHKEKERLEAKLTGDGPSKKGLLDSLKNKLKMNK